jgi:hypothetical protein
MGQSVNQQLGSGSLGYGVDPDYIRSQILQQREKGFQQITNPFQQAAARLGTILGGGLANVANDRGFFEVSDPLLTKVTQIQGIYNQVAGQVDPAADPAKFFSELQKAYSDAGLGQQALMAAQEAQKAKTSGMDVQIKEAQLFKSSPELLAGRIEDARNLGQESEVARLEGLQARITKDRDLDIKARETSIAKDNALISQYQAQAASGNYKFELVDKDRPELGWMRWDLRKGTAPEPVAVPPSILEKMGGNKTTTTGNKDNKDRAPLSAMYKDVQVPPTDGKPRARGKMEQMELDALEEKKNKQELADKPRQDALQQGRDYWNKVQQVAQANGLVPQSTGYFGQMMYVDPRTGAQYTADQLINTGE